MNDCPNAEIRDRLPDLLHERLELSLRAAVVAHVADCIDCQEELELLRTVRGALVAQTLCIDVASVVSALPKPPGIVSRPMRRTWTDWRVAAAVTLLVVGGGSVAIFNRASLGAPMAAPNGVVAVVADSDNPSTSAAPKSSTSDTSPATTASAGTTSAAAGASAAVNTVADGDPNNDARLAGLSAGQLKTLLGDLDHLQALPVAEPEPVSIRVNATSTNPDGGW